MRRGRFSRLQDNVVLFRVEPDNDLDFFNSAGKLVLICAKIAVKWRDKRLN
jgi:hypothetical protein